MPVLQILSSTTVGDCLSEGDSGTTRQQLATNLLGILQEESVKDKKELVKFIRFFASLGAGRGCCFMPSCLGKTLHV